LFGAASHLKSRLKSPSSTTKEEKKKPVKQAADGLCILKAEATLEKPQRSPSKRVKERP
jgi:hypothetical protein